MFPGFSDADFNAYAAAKWRSNVWNRERLGVKEKLLGLGRALAPQALASDGSPLYLESSAEHPTQWNHKQVEAQHVFFSRPPEARKQLDAIIEKGQSIAAQLDDPTPQRNHVFLSLTINHDHAEVALKLHPDARVDRQNIERRIGDHFEREKLLALLTRLPEPFELGVAGAALARASETGEASLAAWIGQLAQPPSPAPSLLAPPVQRLLLLGRRFHRAEAIAAGPSLLEPVAAAFALLVPVYHYFAWSRDSDFVSIRDELQREKQVRRQRGIARGEEVRIARGLFAGKTGLVQEIDARGGIKLLIGNLAVKVPADDLDKG